MSNRLPSASALIAGAVVAFAAPNAVADPQNIKWDDIVRLVDEHPQIREMSSVSKAAEANVDASGALPNPSLAISLGRGVPRDGPGEARLEQSYELTIPLEWLAVRGSQIDIARAEYDETKAQARIVRNEVLSSLASVFWSTAHDQAKIESLETLEAQTQKFTNLVSLRVKKGEARPIEVPRAEIALERVQNELAIARSLLEAHRNQLKIWFRNLQSDWRVDSTLLESFPKNLEQKSSDNLLEKHPVLEAARSRVRALDSTVAFEQWRRFPAFSLNVLAVKELDRKSIGAGIEVTIPIWNWNGSRIDQAKAMAQAERNRAETQSKDLLAKASEAQVACDNNKTTAARYRERILPRAEETARILERTFQIGEASLLEVLDAQRVLVEVRGEYLNSLFQMQLDCIRFELLLGDSR